MLVGLSPCDVSVEWNLEDVMHTGIIPRLPDAAVTRPLPRVFRVGLPSLHGVHLHAASRDGVARGTADVGIFALTLRIGNLAKQRAVDTSWRLLRCQPLIVLFEVRHSL